LVRGCSEWGLAGASLAGLVLPLLEGFWVEHGGKTFLRPYKVCAEGV